MKLLSTLVISIKKHLLFSKEKRSELKRLNKPKRSIELFNKKYPNYKMGVNCYGVPKVKHPLPNTTLTIGNYCSIASNVEIYLGGNHRTDWITSYPFPHFFEKANHIENYEVSSGDVNIGSDVWICQNTTILSGVTIGHGAVIANGAIVTKDIYPYEIVGGNPAKHIRWRFDEQTREILLKSAWWDWPEDELLEIVDILCSNDISKFVNYIKNRHQSNF